MSSTQEVGDIFGAGKGTAQAMLRSPTVLIVSVGLWGMNIFFFRLFGINYRYVLQYDLRKERDSTTTTTTTTTIQEEEEDAADLDGSVKTDSTGILGPGSDNEEDEDEDGEEDLQIINPSTLSPLEDGGRAITWLKLVGFSLSLLVLLHATTHYWMDHLERGVIGAVLFFYGAVLVYIMVPLPSTRWLRRAFWIVLQRSGELIRPRYPCFRQRSSTPFIPRPIPFVDVFYADAMCSLSKVFFDWGMLLHMASHYPDPVPQDIHNILVPSLFGAVPYLIRARQCLVMHSYCRLTNDPKRYQHIANAIKYSTSIWPLVLSAYQKTVSKSFSDQLQPIFLLLVVVNSCYSLYWDVVMDWGMMQKPSAVVQHACSLTSSATSAASISTNAATGKSPSSTARSFVPCTHAILRPRLRFGWKLSALIFAADCCLRFSWLLRYLVHFPSKDAFVLCTQFLEVFRRAIWNLLRVEWEHLKQKEWKRDSWSDRDLDDEFGMIIDKNSNNGMDEEAVAMVPLLLPTTPLDHHGVHHHQAIKRETSRERPNAK